MKYVRVQQKGKRKVVAKIVDSCSGEIVGKGTSCCHKDDKFIFEVGMKIAEERAWKDYEDKAATKKEICLMVSYDKDCIDDCYTLIYSTKYGNTSLDTRIPIKHKINFNDLDEMIKRALGQCYKDFIYAKENYKEEKDLI